jgi:RecB family exonuclease
MALQLRIYDIKQGEMDAWLELFHAKIKPLHAKFDMPVRNAWVAPERSQFVWVRELVGEGTAEEQELRYRESDERAREIGDEPKRFIEAMEVRVVEPVLETQP